MNRQIPPQISAKALAPRASAPARFDQCALHPAAEVSRVDPDESVLRFAGCNEFVDALQGSHHLAVTRRFGERARGHERARERARKRGRGVKSFIALYAF